MEYLKLNNLGNFLDLAALWKAYPRGGKEGDYCNANGYEHYWDKFQREWISSKDLASVPSESLPRETTDIYEDLNLHHDLNVAGVIRGKIEFTSDSKGFENLAEYKAIIERLSKIDITTEEYKTAISDLKTLAEQLKEQANKALTAAEEAEQYINGVLQEELEGIFTQLDGTVTSYFEPYTPTTENYPASEWISLKDKEAHLNDTFTNELDKRSYRWEIVDGEFCWTEIIDPTAASALAAAAKAQDTADGKRKTFTRQPTISDEYEVGDLWVNATYDTLYSNDVLRAVEPKAKGAEFDINHWVLASKYTDDEMANEALGLANQATEDAAALKEMLDKINDDTILDTSEKVHIRTQWELINGTASLNLKGLTGSHYDTIEFARNAGYLTARKETSAISYDGYVLIYDGIRATYPYSTSSDFDLAYEALRDFLVKAKLYSNDYTEEFDRLHMVELFNAYYREETKLFDAAQRYYSLTQAKEAIDNFINGEYLDDIQTLKRQLDQSAQTHVQDTDPYLEWEDEDTRHTHISDIWWNSSDSEINGVPAGATAIYQSKDGEYYWEVTPVPQSLFDRIDGKAQIFISKPSSYNANDMWILEAEYTLGEITYPIGTIVVAIEGSGTFNSSHWVKKDNYTDTSYVDETIRATKEELNEAIEAAQQAADAAGNLAGAAQSAADEAKEDAANAQNTSSAAQEAADNAQQTAESAMEIAQGIQSTTENLQALYSELDKSKVGTEEYNSKVAELINESSRIEGIANDAKTLADTAEKQAKEAIKDSVQAQDIAQSAKTTLDEWSADNVISPFEKQGVSDELTFIVADKDDIDYQKGIYAIDNEDSLYSAYDAAFTKYKGYLTALTATNDAINLQDDFDTVQSTFYDARTAILTAIASAARKVADLAKDAADAAQTLASEADEAARKALEAADKLQVMMENIGDDSTLDIIEKRNIRTQWELINGAETLSAPDADGSYSKALVLAESLGYKNAKSLPVVVTYGGKRITYSGYTPTYAYMGTADLELAYETLREYLRTIRLYTDDAQPGFSRQEFASILTAYYVAESALINNAQAYYTESQKQIALDEAEKALKAAGVSQEILGVTEDLLESVDEADCILTVIEKNSLKQVYSAISDLDYVGEDDDTVLIEGTGSFHKLYASLEDIGSTEAIAALRSLYTRFGNLQTILITTGQIFSESSTVVANNFRSSLYTAIGLYLAEEEAARYTLSRAYTGTVEQSMADQMAQKLGYSSYADLKQYAESEQTIIKGGRLNTTLIEAKAITAAMIAVDELFAQAITASKMTLTEGCNVGGKVSIAGGKILLDTDGSGHLASGAISWDADGDGEISGAWLTPIGETTAALNRTVFIGSSITSCRSVSVGSYDSANVSSSSPVKRLGSVTIISTNTTSPSYIYISGAKIAMPRIVDSSKRVSSLMSLYSYLILAPGSSVTFDVYDEYSNSARVLRSKSPLGWFNLNGSIYPCTYEGARHEDLAAITVTSNAIGSSLAGGDARTVIDLPDDFVKFMKLKVSGNLATTTDGNNNICFQRTDGSGTLTTSYSITTLKTETDIVSSGNTDYRNGGKFGFGHYYGAITYTTSNSPTLYVKLYDSGSMIAYFEITL